MLRNLSGVLVYWLSVLLIAQVPASAQPFKAAVPEEVAEFALYVHHVLEFRAKPLGFVNSGFQLVVANTRRHIPLAVDLVSNNIKT